MGLLAMKIVSLVSAVGFVGILVVALFTFRGMVRKERKRSSGLNHGIETGLYTPDTSEEGSEDRTRTQGTTKDD